MNEFYFTNKEYDVFAREFQDCNDKVVRDIRKRIQEKLLNLNENMLQEIKHAGLTLYNHSNKQNITSLIFPCIFNKGKVNWLGVRYGKNPKDIRELNKALSVGSTSREIGPLEDIKMQFQKHACMQINIGYDGVDIGIFHAVPHGAIDRNYLHEHINNSSEFCNELNLLFKELRGYGYVWHIWDTAPISDNSARGVDPDKAYQLDVENSQTFTDWYKMYDKDGCYSSMLVHFPRMNTRISTENIIDTAITIFKQLYELYKFISWDIHGKE